MAVTTVPEEKPDQTTIYQGEIQTPYASSWFTYLTVGDIPQESVGWMVAQGWRTVGDPTYDTTTVPPTPYYSMAKEGMNNWVILQHLLNSYTTAYNQARKANEVRYNDVVTDWTEMIASTRVHMEAQTTEQNAQVLLYLGNLKTYMDDVDALIDANQNQLVADAVTATDALTALDAKLSDLEGNVDTHTRTIEDLLSAQTVYLGSFLESYTAKMGEYAENYTATFGELETLWGNATTQLATFIDDQDAQLTALEAARSSTRGTVEAALAGEVTSLAGHIAEYDAQLATTETYGDTMRTAVKTLIADKTKALANYLTNYATAIALLATDYASHETESLADHAEALSQLTAHVTDYEEKLSVLGDNYTAHSSTIDDLLVAAKDDTSAFTAAISTLLTTIVGDYDAIDGELSTLLTSGNTMLGSHATDYNAVLAQLEDDYGSHSLTATGFLNNLGATELARLNEEYAASLATQLSELTDQGSYSSSRAQDLRARNTRDRNEAITALNDKLNREKFDNQHRLYEQQVALRARSLDGKDRVHSLRQEFLRYQVEIIVFGQILPHKIRL